LPERRSAFPKRAPETRTFRPVAHAPESDRKRLALPRPLRARYGRSNHGQCSCNPDTPSAGLPWLGIACAHREPQHTPRRGTLSMSQERRVRDRILSDLTDDPSLSELASLCGLSRSHFTRAFKNTIGLPPHRWLLMQRIERAKSLLAQTGVSISQIAIECGFADQSDFTVTIGGKPAGPASGMRCSFTRTPLEIRLSDSSPSLCFERLFHAQPHGSEAALCIQSKSPRRGANQAPVFPAAPSPRRASSCWRGGASPSRRSVSWAALAGAGARPRRG
jgi:AraC-like DNA-binding protein